MSGKLAAKERKDRKENRKGRGAGRAPRVPLRQNPSSASSPACSLLTTRYFSSPAIVSGSVPVQPSEPRAPRQRRRS